MLYREGLVYQKKVSRQLPCWRVANVSVLFLSLGSCQLGPGGSNSSSWWADWWSGPFMEIWSYRGEEVFETMVRSNTRFYAGKMSTLDVNRDYSGKVDWMRVSLKLSVVRVRIMMCVKESEVLFYSTHLSHVWKEDKQRSSFPHIKAYVYKCGRFSSSHWVVQWLDLTPRSWIQRYHVH